MAGWWRFSGHLTGVRATEVLGKLGPGQLGLRAQLSAPKKWIVGQRWIFLLIQGHLVPGLFFSFLCSYIQKCFFWVRAEILLLCAEKLPFLGFMQKYSKKYSPLLLGPGKLGSRGPIQLSRPNLPRTCGNRMGSWQIVPRTVGPVVRHQKVDSWAQLSGDAFASKTNSRKERKEVNKNQTGFQSKAAKTWPIDDFLLVTFISKPAITQYTMMNQEIWLLCY